KAVDDAGTPLYRTVLDGVDAMRDKAKEGTMNIVIVLTDGQDEESDFTMTQQAFLAQLQEDADPAKPVPVIAVGLGQDADMNALNAMAKATGGQAISATNPADVASAIAQAFLAAHAPR
ncbi:VWA domain-containing protein, partial [Actinoplanes sp. RD1]|uniref:VWA domain-containing protein n=1 Tax=Actinoplanes sp. RD1 TaxID=3064538 RepID=UPI0027413F8E